MAKKPNISNVASGYQSTTTINNNFENIRNAFDNTLSRDGSTPNSMLADFDMNSNDILNVDKLYINGLYIDGQPVSAGTLNYNGVIKETQTATSGQTVFNLNTLTYKPGINNLSVYIDGVYQNPSTYIENTTSRITFTAGLHVGAVVDFVALSVNDLSGTTDATSVTYTPSAQSLYGTSDITVKSALDQISNEGTGSSKVGFLQSGTGATARTVQAKLRDVISVKDFGAIGNGVADDTAAVQAAVDSVSYTTSGFYGEVTGKILFFPAGTYKITAAINVPVNGGLSFFGEGKTKSTVWQSTNDANIFNVSGNNFRGEFYGMRLTGNQGQVSGPSKAINIGPNGNQIFVQNCWFNTTGYAIYGYPTSDSNFINNTFEYIHTPIYLAGSGNGYFTIADNVFYNCGPVSQGASEQRASFEFQNTTQTIFTSNRFVSDSPMSPQSGGYILINNCVDFIMSDNVMGVNSLTAANIIITNSSKVRIDNNTLPEAARQQMSINGCTDIVVSNNRLSTMKNLGSSGDNLIDVINTKKFRFIGNYLGSATSYVMYVRTTCEDIVIANNNFDGGAYTAAYRTLLMETTSKAVVTGNTFRNGLNGEDFTCGNTTNLVFSGNTLDLGFSIDTGVAPSSVFGNVGGTTRTYLNAAPGGGTWKQGDIVWFQQPISGGYIGAVCVADGTPGTWKNFGLIA